MVAAGGYGRSDLTSAASADAPGSAPVSVASFQMRAVQVAGLYRQYLGNAVYGSAGLGWRRIVSEYDIEASASGDAFGSGARASSLVAVVEVGQEWQWENGVVAGIAWAGASVPLCAKYDSASMARGASAIDVEDRHARDDEYARALARMVVPAWGVASVGYAW